MKGNEDCLRKESQIYTVSVKLFLKEGWYITCIICLGVQFIDSDFHNNTLRK